MLGRLNHDAFKHDLIEWGAGFSMILGGIALIILITYLKRWKWLWNEWITSLDPKKIGIMYIVVSAIMLFKGLIDALMMRAQQAIAISESAGYLSASHFQQVFTAHGATMIFFVAMGVVFGLINIIMPLQIGARDVAFPFINSLGFWLFSVGGFMILLSLVVGNFSGAGWLGYPPLTELQYNPGVGIDYWIWTLQVSGAGTLMGGINFLVTILKMRAPGMTLMKMPLFTWSVLATMILVVFAFPILTGALGLLSLDRLIDTHFFTAGMGGNQMMFVNLIWAWGHPEVYILVLPAFGIYSEVVATFSHKRLFGYTSMVWAIGVITLLSFVVWLHHFFTMGASPNINAFFGLMTMLIAIPTGVKVFNWIFTMFKGRVVFTTPMLWFLAFVFVFTIGGMAGVMMSVPPADFQVHNSLFLVAHFHSVIIGGVLFGFFAGFTYWFPKIFGFHLNETLGKWAFWFWFSGFLTAFIPLYILGLMGATRRLNYYDASTGWQPLFIVAACGIMLILCGFGFQLLQILVSIRDRKKNADTTGDPWNGRTLEWSTTSPAPHYNFALIPRVFHRDAFWVEKHEHRTKQEDLHYEDILMPKNSSLGFIIAWSAFFCVFGLIWYMWWLAILGFAGVVIALIVRLSDDNYEEVIPAAEVEKHEAETHQRT